MDCRRSIGHFIGKHALNHVNALMVHGNAIDSQNMVTAVCLCTFYRPIIPLQLAVFKGMTYNPNNFFAL